jgi:hypothetical protein
VRRLFAHAPISFSMKLPQTVSANHVCLPCHAGFTSNGAGSRVVASGPGVGGHTQRSDEVGRHHHVAGDEVVYRRSAQAHHRRVDAITE